MTILGLPHIVPLTVIPFAVYTLCPVLLPLLWHLWNLFHEVTHPVIQLESPQYPSIFPLTGFSSLGTGIP